MIFFFARFRTPTLGYERKDQRNCKELRGQDESFDTS
jgi:hypothetical protein